MTEWQMLVNGVSIALEAAGFLIMLFNTISAKRRGGGFITSYVDDRTGKQPENVVFIADAKRYNLGIGLVLAGLAGQVVATFVT